jgi:hypothetical protein
MGFLTSIGIENFRYQPRYVSLLEQVERMIDMDIARASANFQSDQITPISDVSANFSMPTVPESVRGKLFFSAT